MLTQSRARTRLAGILFFALTLLSAPAQADTFPSRVVRIVVPFGAGGTADITARRLADALSKKWGQPVIVENKPGAGFMVGALTVARAPADGYTIFLATELPLSTTHLMAKSPQVNPFTEFAPVMTLIRFPLAIAVGASVPAHNLKELAELAKTRRLNYGSLGPGTAPHLAAELFLSISRTEMVAIPYRATAPALLALATGEIQVLAVSPGTLMPAIRSGQARFLATDGPSRFYQTPDVPTFAEAGFGEMRAPAWWAIVTTANTPKDVVAKLNAGLNEVIKQPDMVKYFHDAGFEPVGGTPEQLSALMKDTEQLWAPTIKRLGLQLD